MSEQYPSPELQKEIDRVIAGIIARNEAYAIINALAMQRAEIPEHMFAEKGGVINPP